MLSSQYLSHCGVGISRGPHSERSGLLTYEIVVFLTFLPKLPPSVMCTNPIHQGTTTCEIRQKHTINHTYIAMFSRISACLWCVKIYPCFCNLPHMHMTCYCSKRININKLPSGKLNDISRAPCCSMASEWCHSTHLDCIFVGTNILDGSML